MNATQHASQRRNASSVLARYRHIRDTTEELASPLGPEDQTLQSMSDTSPTKWHRAHTSWFFETFILKRHQSGYRPFCPDYEVLFNSYYESVGEQFPRPRRGILSRPTSSEVADFRAHVDEAMAALLQAPPSPDVLALTELGLQHEQQHQELLMTDIKHAFSQNPLAPAYREIPARDETSVTSTSTPEFVQFSGGIVEVGHEGAEFCYDNELPRHRVLLEDFELASRPLCNADVLNFIEAGGYKDPLLWLSDGWRFKEQAGLKAPLYWQQTSNGFEEFTLHGRLPLDPAGTACHLSFFEADAIARFFGARLPTEQEWEVAALRTLENDLSGHFLDPKGLLHPRAASGSQQLAQLFGSVWEWTASPYTPYPGFEAAPGAIGEYNGKFMHNQFVLRGGSCVTPRGHIRASYRNFFPSSAQWQFSGARLARRICA